MFAFVLLKFLFLVLFSCPISGGLFFADIFSQVSNTDGHLDWQCFHEYMKALLALPAAVHEGPSFGFSNTAVKACFDGVSSKGT